METLEKNGAQAARYEGKAFIFSDIASQEKVTAVLCRAFGLDPEGKGDTLVLHNEDIEVRLAVACQSAGQEAEEFIDRQTEAACAHFYQVKTEAAEVKTNLLYQIGRAKGFILVEYEFDVEENRSVAEKKNMVENMFVNLLGELEGIMLIQDKEKGTDAFYCRGEKGERLLVMSDKGQTSFRCYLPYQEPVLRARKDLSKEQIERRMRTMETLMLKGIYVPAEFPVVKDGAAVTCPSLEEMAKRALALMGVAIYSGCMLDEEQGFKGAQMFLMDYIDNNNTQDYFSPAEWEYIHNMKATKKEQHHFIRQYEALYIMEWALGLVENLEFPDHPCDAQMLIKSLRKGTSISRVMAKSKPKSPREILDVYDMVSCIHWACLSAREHDLPAPAGMNLGIVNLWHRTLNWLIGRGDWDQVKADIE